MEENQPAPTVGPPTVLVMGTSCGAQPDGSVTVTLYSWASVSDFKSTVPTVALTGLIPASVAQDLLTNLDGAIMAAAKNKEK